MNNKLNEKYGLFTAICAVVGIVIGSGIFFKAQNVIQSANGNMGGAIGIVVVMGLIMLVCALTFSTLASKYEKMNGVVDYAECTVGKKYAFFTNWFMTVIYTPVITCVLSWVSARYTCVLFGWAPFAERHLALTAFYLIAIYTFNVISPKFAGKFQVSTTIIKLVPIAVMAVIGTIAGLINGVTLETFTTIAEAGANTNISFFSGIAAFAFAYEGWIVITSLNAEIKNSKKNLPIAITFGCLAVIAIYVLYYVGIASVLTADEIYTSADIPMDAFSKLFGSKIVGSLVYVFIVISCLGTTNALMMGCTRGIYSMAVRNQGIMPEVFSEVSPKTNMPHNSAVAGLALCGFWLLQFIICFQSTFINGTPIVPPSFSWESDEVVIITIYAIYIPIFIAFMAKGKGVGAVKRFVLPSLAIVACLFMCYSAYQAYKANGMIWNYLITFAVIMLVGMLLYGGKFGLSFFKKEKANATEVSSEVISDAE